MRTSVIAGLLGPLLVLWGVAAGQHGQGTFESLPGHDRYQAVLEAQRPMRRSGRIRRVEWTEDGTALLFHRDDKAFRFNLESRELAEVTEAEPEAQSGRSGRESPDRRRSRRGRQRDRQPSPDGVWEAVCREYNVVLERTDGSATLPVTTRGHRKVRYGTASWVYGEELAQRSAMWWSPDSTMLAFYELDERGVHDYYLTAGLTELWTELLTEGYPKAGESNPVAGVLVYHLPSGSLIRMDVGEDLEQYVYQVRFATDGGTLLFNRTNRRQDVLELVAADPRTGTSRVVVRETQPTWQKNRPSIEFLQDGQRFIWETEKTGWRQYELRHLDGRRLGTLTRGAYPAGAVLEVDEQAGVMYYMAYSGEHPLNAHLHRVGLDGRGQTRLTPDDGNHSIQLSPDRRWFISTCETINTPPTTALYDTEGNRVATLAESDISRFNELGLQAPEPFTFKADDGVTDLYGVLYKPSKFDPARRYPLVIDVYGGPLSQRVRNRYRPANAYCEFGFLIAVIDNRGTTGRGKAFESATYLKLGDVDLKDQADGVRYLARRPYVDGDRVGIFGHSYGGYMAALAPLKRPEVFHVAVASSAVTDWRNYDTIYTERFMRTPQENPEGYERGSCLGAVEQLTGKLLIMHGMLDDNVHPSNAWQLIHALQQAGKPFEMMLFPRSGHGAPATARRLRWTFLYRHLIEEATPMESGQALRRSDEATEGGLGSDEVTE